MFSHDKKTDTKGIDTCIFNAKTIIMWIIIIVVVVVCSPCIYAAIRYWERIKASIDSYSRQRIDTKDVLFDDIEIERDREDFAYDSPEATAKRNRAKSGK